MKPVHASVKLPAIRLSMFLTVVAPILLIMVSATVQAAPRCSDVLSSASEKGFVKGNLKAGFVARERFSEDMLKAFDDLKNEWTLELNVDTTRRFIEIDSKSSFNKADVFKSLGFKWKAQEVATAPDFYEFAMRFHGQMIQHGYKNSKYLRPALVFVKNDPTAPEGMIYKLVDPFQEGFTEIPAGFARLPRNAETFNLPFSVIMQGLKDGLFPLMGGLHDVSHFVGLLQNKDMSVALVENIRKLPPKGSKHLGRRIILLMEYFTAMSGQPRATVKKYLKDELRITSLPTRLQIKNQLLELPQQALLQRAARSAELLDKVIVDFGGASVASWEKIYDLSKMLLDTQDSSTQLANFPKLGNDGVYNLAPLLAFHEQMFVGRSMNSRFGGQYLQTRYREQMYDVIIRLYPRLYTIVAKEFLNHLSGSRQEGLGWSLNFPETNYTIQKPREYTLPSGEVRHSYTMEITPEGRNYLRQVLVDLTSAIEFQLAQAAYGLSPAEFVAALLQPKVTKEDPLGHYFQQLYPGFIKDSELLDP